MSNKIIILGTPHGVNVAGKASPDGRFLEYAYGREIVKSLQQVLVEDGYRVYVDYMANVVPDVQRDELILRCNIVNAICRKFGKENCIYVSVHVNASGLDTSWRSARGWSVYTSVGQTKSDELATCLWNAAKETLPSSIRMREDRGDGDVDFESNLYVLKHTLCAAVLTENLFMDNKEDLAYLESDEGKAAIVELHRRGIERFLGVKSVE